MWSGGSCGGEVGGRCGREAAGGLPATLTRQTLHQAYTAAAGAPSLGLGNRRGAAVGGGGGACELRVGVHEPRGRGGDWWWWPLPQGETPPGGRLEAPGVKGSR